MFQSPSESAWPFTMAWVERLPVSRITAATESPSAAS